MRLSLNWLREFVPFEGEVQGLADRLTMLGLEVEEIVRPFAALESMVVGHVVSCERHPQADKLSVCRVDVGGPETLSIVCGAPNVAAGQTVAVAPIGATMPDGMSIKKTKLRGVESCGMICSERELGLSEDHSGIMVLEPEIAELSGRFRAGRRLVEALGLDTEVLEVSITPNRADCLSILGLAREIALAYGLPLSLPKVHVREADPSLGDVADLYRIDIPEGEFCPVYRARLITGVSVGPSPARVRYRLVAAGQRPINNVVDATNYIMLEVGQPLHAFDRERLAGSVIRVARSEEGRVFKTLDGQERVLTDQDLLIWDADKPVALAGVMGGENSEVMDGTNTILLEAAVFRPATIRKTARRLGLPSEASYRFERGVDQGVSLYAMNKAAEMIGELSGGTVLKGFAAAEPVPLVQRTVPFRPSRAVKILGIPVEAEFSRRTLVGLGCGLDLSGGASWKVDVPSHRLDLEREIDLIEEVGRVWGLDRIPASLPSVSKSLDTLGAVGGNFAFLSRIKGWGRSVGLNEVINFSFVSGKDLNILGLPQEGRVPVANPLSEDQSVLRSAVAPGLLLSLRHNLSQDNGALRLFEVSKIFTADPEGETKTAEADRLGILLYGSRNPGGWPYGEEDVAYDDLKGLVEHLLGELKLEAGTYTLRTGHTFLSPCVEVAVKGETIGLLGRVLPEIADEYNGRKDVWLAEVDLGRLAGLAGAVARSFKGLPVFPPVRRDMTLVAPASLSVAAVHGEIAKLSIGLLEDVRLIDVYVPAVVPGAEQERNLTFRLTYRHKAKTLSDKEVDKEHGKVTGALVKNLPVRFQ